MTEACRVPTRRGPAARRAEQLDRQRRGRRTCPAKHGSRTCGGVLEHDVLRDGRVRTRCPRCERRLAGICQECPRPVEGRIGLALRCRECKRRERARAGARWRQRHPEVRERQRRQRAWIKAKDPERYAHRLATKKAWRARNTARIKMQKRKWRLDPNRPNGYSSREKYEAYHRAYRERHREHYRELARRNAADRRAGRGPVFCACGCGREISWDGRFRPRKWLPEHYPHARGLTAKEVAVKTTQAAIRMLHRGAERIRKKLAGVEELQAELEAINAAIGELQKVASGEVATEAPKRRGRRGAAA